MARKDEILDALVEIFRKQGIGSDFTISQLAQEVNIGKSTIYEYFKTKEEIVEQAVKRVITKAVDMIQNEEPVIGDFEEMFKVELKRLFNLAQSSRFLVNLVSPTDKKIMSPECRKDVEEKIDTVRNFYQTRFEMIFGVGIQEGLLNASLLLENQLILTSIVIGNIMQLANGRIEETANINVDSLIDKVYIAVLKIVN